jgi:hypothetical protein
VKIRIIAAFVSAGLVAACSGGTPSPAGWQPVPGASPDSQWSTGSGASVKTYTYEKRPFAGTLQELASTQATSLVAAAKGTHFNGSDTFASCPGQAAIANFTTGNDRQMVQGVGVRNGTAVVVSYVRPTNAVMSPEVAKAMEAALCGSTF